jgi:hypothetical protein
MLSVKILDINVLNSVPRVKKYFLDEFSRGDQVRHASAYILSASLPTVVP